MSDSIDFTSFDLVAETQLRLTAQSGFSSVKVDSTKFKVQFGSPIYGTPVSVDLPPETLDEAIVDNTTGTAEITEHVLKSGTFDAVASRTMTHTVEGNFTQTLPITFPIIGNINFGLTANNTQATETQNSVTREQTFTESLDIPVAAGKKEIVTLKVTPVQTTIPFNALVRIEAVFSNHGILNTGICISTVGIGTLFIHKPSPQVHV
ncbi:MAG: aerolysin family beta-barrel pore-forming toxin, partial [Patescibacteria group bacterium]|nr:aerolysin family beta-barrel pore-forming toxin [Patescibacteria group bacterium]